MRETASINRRQFLGVSTSVLAAGALATLPGCDGAGPQFGTLDRVWGQRGIVGGRFQRPRAMAIDAADRLYIVDFLARIHVFDADGNFLRAWRTPEFKNGKPTGISVEGDRLLVADTHYFRVLWYTLDGELIDEATLGGVHGEAAGEFGLVTDAAYDSRGHLYVSQYGGWDRIQKFAVGSDGSYEHLRQWGIYGDAPGQFSRPQNMLIDAKDRIWVCDACNHRLQVFDTEGNVLEILGSEGDAPGQMRYPYDMAMADDGTLFICEYGNHRVQHLTQQGKSLGIWGENGRGPGELHNPWSLALDSRGRLHVLDTWNHRVQRVIP